MARRFVTLAALGAAALSTHCVTEGTETDNPAGPEGVELRRSTLPYLSAVDVSAEDRDALGAARRAFALDLYANVAAASAADDNLFLGPHGIATVLSMTLAGARGSTADEIAAVLHWEGAPEALHPAVNQLEQALRAGIEGSRVRFDTMNSLWVAEDSETAAGFLDVLSQQYDTGVYAVDFAGDSDGARQSINDWVSDQTDGLIDELFAPGAIDPTTSLALTNAAYLSAPWQNRFDPEGTSPGEFALSDGEVVEVQMMHREHHDPFVFDVDWRAVELPFAGVNQGMIFVLPNSGEFEQFESSLDTARLDEIVSALEAVDVSPGASTPLDLAIPRFEFSANVDLQPSLEALGMPSAFRLDAADFSGIDPAGDIYVSTLVHRTTIGVDEQGTTAATATGEVLETLSIRPSLHFDRPFIFLIYDHDTRSVLFIGRYARPDGAARPPDEPPLETTDAETICDVLAGCTDRTTTRTECLDALADDDPLVLEQCADCHLVGADACAGLPGCGFAPDVCQPDTCAEYCPTHAF